MKDKFKVESLKVTKSNPPLPPFTKGGRGGITKVLLFTFYFLLFCVLAHPTRKGSIEKVKS